MEEGGSYVVGKEHDLLLGEFKSLIAQCPRGQLLDSLQDFIHNNFFLGWGTSEMCHLFKISTIGRGFKVDYVCHMFKGDLAHYWVFLHHIKQLKN